MAGRTGVRTAAIVLLAIVSTAVSMPVSASVIFSTQHKDECPMHKGSPVSPSPVKHNCCQPGHHFVLLREPASPRDGAALRLQHASEFDGSIAHTFEVAFGLSCREATRSPGSQLRI